MALGPSFFHMIIALDPGKNIGLAEVDSAGKLIKHAILTLEQVKTYDFPEDRVIIVGNGTGSKQLLSVLKQKNIIGLTLDETGTSLEAKELYFQANPPKGLSKLMPKGLRSPPELIDDYAAYAIALRYLKQK